MLDTHACNKPFLNSSTRAIRKVIARYGDGTTSFVQKKAKVYLS